MCCCSARHCPLAPALISCATGAPTSVRRIPQGRYHGDRRCRRIRQGAAVDDVRRMRRAAVTDNKRPRREQRARRSRYIYVRHERYTCAITCGAGAAADSDNPVTAATAISTDAMADCLSHAANLTS